MAGPRKKASANEMSLHDVIQKALPSGYRPVDTPAWISTGVDLLDWTLGGRGIPTGRVVEIAGVEGSGKTMLALQCARSTLMQGGEVIYCDTESGLDLNWARKIGAAPERMYLCSPLWLEELHNVVEQVVENRESAETPTLIVWDSVAATLAKEYVEAPVGDCNSPAMEARLNARFFGRKWMQRMMGSRIALIMLNQPRNSIGRYGPSETTPGGRVLRHAASLRVHMAKGHDVQSFYDDSVVGHRVVFTVVKNKLTGRLLSSEVSTALDKGIDNTLTSLHYVFDTMKNAQGRISYQDRSWFRRELYEHLQNDPSELEAFRQYALKVFTGEAQPDR